MLLASRSDFLNALHEGCEGVCELRALPSEARTFARAGDEAAVARFAKTRAAENVYIAVATRKDTRSGKLENCLHLAALFVDLDFKVTPEPEARDRLARFPLPPSAIVQTGGGLHAYWFLREPMMLLDEAASARALLRRLAHALDGDLAAAEPARVLRLPGTVNRKYTPPRAVMVEMLNVNRRYNPADFDEILPPEPTTNGYAAAFTMPDEPLAEGEGRNNILYRLVRALRAKKVNARTIVTAVEEENARFRPPLPVDELHALLEHALTQADRPDFTAERNGHQPKPADPRMTIAVSGDLVTMTRAAWEALTVANDPAVMFRRGSVPSRLEAADDGAPLIRPLTPERTRYALARCARWESTERTRKGERAVEVYPPVAVVLDVLATPNPALPVLDRVVEVPVFTAAGRLRTAPGYDPEGRTYFAPPAALSLPSIPGHPTPAETGAAALLLLNDLLGDFCFVSGSERAHALALLLLPFLRELIPGPTPLHLIEAPTPGTGKTLLADVVLWPAFGRPVPAMAEGRDEDEWRKRITSKLVAGANVVFLDNLRRRLDSAAVSSAITAPAWEDRILGRSETQTVPVRCAWVASGNNPALSLEMTRRTVRVRLDARTEEPWRRSGFRHADLRTWVKDQRGRLIAAALTLGRAWLDAGRPPGATALGMFEDWARVLGGVLAVAGVDDFLANLDAFYADADLEGAEIRGFLAAWWTAHSESRVTAADLLNVEPLPGRVADGGKGREDRGRATRLGKLLSSLRDRHYRLSEGPTVRVERAGEAQRAAYWRLKSTPGGGM
jgi:hypothetical protein